MPRLTQIRLHRYLAIGLGFFIATHLTIHMTALISIETHRTVLSFIRPIYRNPVVEPLLILAILSQILVGIRLVMKRWGLPDKGAWGWTQILSGLYLVYFLLAHTAAALATRHLYELDTDFYWGAAPVNTAPLIYVFIPYYFLGVTAIFAHFASALHFGWPESPKWLPPTLFAGGAMIGAFIVAAFAGVFYDIVLPPENLDYIDRLLGRS